MNYLWHVIAMTGLYVAVASALNLLSGYVGLISLCSAGFVGLGAYVTAVLTAHYGLPWAVTLLIGAALAAAMAAVIASASLRLRHDYFVVATFAFQVVLMGLALNWTGVTGGALGVSAIPPLSFLGLQMTEPWQFAAVFVLFACLTILFVLRVTRSPYGRALRLIREDELLAAAMGKNVRAIRVSVFVAGAIPMALVGAVYASYVGYVAPDLLSVNESILMLSIVIVGGNGSLAGPVLGALLLIGFPEVLRLVGMPSSIGANLREILYGLLLIGCMLWRPKGLVGRYAIRGTEIQ